MNMTTNRTYTGPTDTDYYATWAVEAIEKVIAKAAADGSFIAANSGADHPLAQEYAKMWAAATGALLLRQAA